MMRSMFSGVAGLKTHQTKMDVIGNNIANVNTTSFKADSVNFSELLYQTRSYASAANEDTGRAGINANQIGLGVQVAAINSSVTTGGAALSTNNPFDVKINGDAFFIVSPDQTSHYFTRDGSFYVDGMGNLATTANGYSVMGWQVDKASETIRKDTVSALRVMSAENMQYPPEATTKAYIEGILDKNEPDAKTDAGKALSLTFYDDLGYIYTAKFAIKDNENVQGGYTVELDDIIDSEGRSLKEVYNVNSLDLIAGFGESAGGGEYSRVQDINSDADPTSGNPTYDSTDQEFTYDMTLKEAIANMSDAVPFAKDWAVKDAGPTAAGKDVVLTGSGGSIDKNTLQTSYKLIYVQPTTGDPYYLAPDKTQLDENDPEAWEKYLNLIDPDTNQPKAKITAVTFDKYGGIELQVEQTFKAKYDFEALAADDESVQTKIKYEDYGNDTAANHNAAVELLNKIYNVKPGESIENISDMGSVLITKKAMIQGFDLQFNTENGLLGYVNKAGETTTKVEFMTSLTNNAGDKIDLSAFKDIEIDWSKIVWYNNGGASTMTATAGEEKTGLGAGRRVGNLNGVSIQPDGRVYTTYDNGMNRLVGQIAVARFSNASGLEKAGENLYMTTSNSGTFNGIGEEITQNGTDNMTTGVLEMSNVDLSNEFTHMITTQRGFQANSRIITVSDTLLEELVNLKR